MHLLPCKSIKSRDCRFRRGDSISEGSKYRISGSYRMGAFHIGYRISEEISGIRAHIGIYMIISDTIYNEILIIKS